LKRIAIVGKEDKRQITAVLGFSMSGNVLPFHEGKMSRYLPNYGFSEGFDVTCNVTQWLNETVMLRYLEKMIVFPCFSKARLFCRLPCITFV